MLILDLRYWRYRLDKMLIINIKYLKSPISNH